MNPLELAQEAVEIVVAHGTHHTGKKHSETHPLTCLKHASEEIVELSYETGLALMLKATDGDILPNELADAFIALFHYQQKMEITNRRLALAIIKKLLARNTMPDLHRDRLYAIEHKLEEQTRPVSTTLEQ